MPGQDGISFYKNLQQNVLVIFTTAFDHYAIEGFNVDAVDYLLKPFSPERFGKAVAKAEKMISRSGQNSDNEFLFLRADYQLHKIKFSDILFIQSDDDYIRVFFTNNDRSRIFRFTLKEIGNKLPEKDFIRIHRSYIVRKDKIEKMGNKTITIQNHELPVGSVFEADLKKFMKMT